MLETIPPETERITDRIAVTLSGDEWKQLLGMTTNGVGLLLSQLALQPNGLPEVAQLSVTADRILALVKQQLG